MRTIVLVGATSGLGKLAARRLTAAGHRMVLIGRDPDRAARLAGELPSATVITADVATAAGAVRAAQQVADTVDRIDTLVNNAGVMTPERRVTAEGMELNFAVHHLAPYSLTSHLLPLLHKGAGRVINVNSEGHRAPLRGSGPVELDFEDLQSHRTFDPFLVYSRTKLANLLFTYELHRRHPELTVAALHPGMVRTDLGRDFPLALRTLALAMAGPAASGAEPVVRLATDEEISAGSYYNRLTPVTSSPASLNRAVAERLWMETARLRGPFGGSG